MTKVGRPPVLRVGHEGGKVLLQCIVVELLELVGVVEVGAEGVLSGVVLAQDVCPEIIGPPVGVPGASASDVGDLDGTLAFGHDGWLGRVCCESVEWEHKLARRMVERHLGIYVCDGR